MTMPPLQRSGIEPMRRIMIFFFSMALAACCRNATLPSASGINDFSTKYSQARSEVARLQLCVSAMNSGLIRNGMSVSDVEKLFGTKLQERIPIRKDYTAVLIIGLADPPPSLPDGDQAPSGNWYMGVEYVNGGAVVNYYLSNSHMK